MTSDGATRQLDLVGEGWSPFPAAVAGLALDQLEHVTPAGWTVKEMLAHISFREETVKPFVVGWLRGEPDESIEGWYGGTNLGLTREKIASATWCHYAEHLRELEVVATKGPTEPC